MNSDLLDGRRQKKSFRIRFQLHKTSVLFYCLSNFRCIIAHTIAVNVNLGGKWQMLSHLHLCCTGTFSFSGEDLIPSEARTEVLKTAALLAKKKTGKTVKCLTRSTPKITKRRARQRLPAAGQSVVLSGHAGGAGGDEAGNSRVLVLPRGAEITPAFPAGPLQDERSLATYLGALEPVPLDQIHRIELLGASTLGPMEEEEDKEVVSLVKVETMEEIIEIGCSSAFSSDREEAIFS
jgi:hypothetical protein